MTLEEFLYAVADEAGAARSAAADGGVEFHRGGRAFASATGGAAEFRLEAEIVDAALRTPATAASARGPDWVRLAPPDVAQHDLDRARAWFLSAWRKAERKAG